MVAIPKPAERLVDEVAEMLEPMLARKEARPDVLLVERDGQYEFYRGGRRGLTLLARGDADNFGHDALPQDVLGRPVEVRLDAARLFRKMLQLPAASRSYLDAVVAHQIERSTPWAADRVVFGYSVAEGASAGADQIDVRLVATSRESFDTAMERFARAGLRPSVVGLSDDPLDRPSAINLLQGGQAARKELLRERIWIGLLGFAALALTLCALAGWHLRRLDGEVAEVAASIEAARGVIASARGSGTNSEAYRRLLDLKRGAVPMMVLLEDLSGLLPASTYLTELSATGEQLRLAGLSSEAPALIGILENANRFDQVRFAAPTIRGEGGMQDHFEIVARILPGTAPGDGPDAGEPAIRGAVPDEPAPDPLGEVPLE